MARMVEAVQPHCDEEIVAALTCSHGGSMRSLVLSRLFGGSRAGNTSCPLPNPVFIAVGRDHIYAFDFKPRGFKYKIKKEVARWPKNEIRVTRDNSPAVSHFVLTTATGETYPLEVPTMLGGKELVRFFLDSFEERVPEN